MISEACCRATDQTRAQAHRRGRNEMNQIRTAAHSGSKLNARSAALLAAMMLAVFGGVFVYGIGFAGASVLHNAAHDARHANNFPCH